MESISPGSDVVNIFIVISWVFRELAGLIHKKNKIRKANSIAPPEDRNTSRPGK
jgi:hypothetical protein